MLLLQAMKNALLILFALVFLGCTSNKDIEIPDSVISQQKMVDLTIDLKIIEGAINLNHYNVVTQKHVIDSLYQTVYNKHQVTKAKVDSSLIFYASQPELLGAIYDSALVKINFIK